MMAGSGSSTAVGGPARHHPVLQLVQQFSYAEGQHEGRWFGNVTVTADSKATAEKLKQVFEGLLAIVSLHFHDQKSIGESLDKVKVSVDDNAVKMTFDESADNLAEQVPAICKEIHKHLKMHRKHARHSEKHEERHSEKHEERHSETHEDRDEH
jgi:DNA gyrase/topoisomerase IV subunit B